MTRAFDHAGCPTLPALFAGGWALAHEHDTHSLSPPRGPLRLDLDHSFSNNKSSSTDARRSPIFCDRGRDFLRPAFLGLAVMTLSYAPYCHNVVFLQEHGFIRRVNVVRVPRTHTLRVCAERTRFPRRSQQVGHQRRGLSGIGGIGLPKLGAHPLLLHAELEPEHKEDQDENDDPAHLRDGNRHA